MKKIRILIADDHPVVRSGLRGMLESQTDFEVAGEAGDGAEAERMTRGLTPDVVLMDLRMPQIDGVEAIRTIKKSRPETAILVLTTYDSEADIVFAVEAGASGYLLKDVGPEELFNGIRAANRGETVLSPAVAKRILERVRMPEYERLSPCEIDVLRHAARGTRNREIAEAVGVSEATVKSHLSSIYRKLGVNDRTAAVTKAIREGFITV